MWKVRDTRQNITNMSAGKRYDTQPARSGQQHMEFNACKQYIHDHTTDLLDTFTERAKSPVNGMPSYVCKCGHGKNGDGLTFNRKSKNRSYELKCFSCDFRGDIIDYVGDLFGCQMMEAIGICADKLGIALDKPTCPTGYQTSTQHKSQDRAAVQTGMTEGPKQEAAAPAGIPPDYTAYYAECVERIGDPAAVEYLLSRGITGETAKAYYIGYDPQADPAAAPAALANSGTPKLHPCPRIICPTTTAHYVARSIDPTCDKRFLKLNPKGAGRIGIFNIAALDQQPEAIFVTEGFFNALSYIEAGACALATNSASNCGILIQELKRRKVETTLILAFDNDSAGRKATLQMRAELDRLNIPYIVAENTVTGRGDEAPDGHKEDANDLLVKDRPGFFAAVARVLMQTAPKPDNDSAYIDTLMAADIAAMSVSIPTGYSNLDQQSGGLYPGLYVIGAVSSLGKTTFVSQMAYQIAAGGHDVLFFSLEQSRLELVSKHIARQTYLINPNAATTSLQIRRGGWNDITITALGTYKETVGDRLSTIEGNFNCDIAYIGRYISRYIRKNADSNGRQVKPVVVIDYLQILQPLEGVERQTQKQIVDMSMTELKRLSRALGITVIAISSVNRANYIAPVDFEALKESGGIEYTADVVWGLQLHCLTTDPVFEKANNIAERRQKVREEKAKTPRDIDLVCLKNRYGISSYTCSFQYWPAYDYFKPSLTGGVEVPY